MGQTRRPSVPKQNLAEEKSKQIEHFFQRCKDLEPRKFVRTLGWEGADAARAEILRGVEDYNRGG